MIHTLKLLHERAVATVINFNDSKNIMLVASCRGNGACDVTIVLTDIKNFSYIVLSAYHNDLNEVMSKYYHEARKLVFEYSDVLDKSIGDAVLAIFNYPKKETIQ